MKRRKWLAIGAMLLLAIPFSLHAQDTPGGDAPIIAGSTDSTEQASRWFYVYGAKKVILRVWSEHAAFTVSGSVENDADSLFSDSLVTFTVLTSDSIRTNVNFSSAASDSAVYDPTAGTDTTMRAYPLPINKPLRAPSNGSGLITYICPVSVSSIAAGALQVHADPQGTFGKKYMRVRVTPLRRTRGSAGGLATQGARTNGIKGLHISEIVVYSGGDRYSK